MDISDLIIWARRDQFIHYMEGDHSYDRYCYQFISQLPTSYPKWINKETIWPSVAEDIENLSCDRKTGLNPIIFVR